MQSNRKHAILITILVTVILGFNQLANAKTKDASLDKIAVVVNNSVILQSELDRQIKVAKMQFASMGAGNMPYAQLKQQVLDKMILQKGVMELAEKMGLKISDEEVLLAMQNIASSQNVSIARMKEEIKRQGMSFADYREEIRQQMVMTKVQQYQIGSRIQITDNEVEDFLRTTAGASLDKREFKLGHILVSLSENPSSEEIQKAQTQIKALKKQLLANPHSFNQVLANAQAKSGEITGGVLEWQKVLQLPSLFGEQVGRMKLKDVIAPLRSSSGLHLIQLLEKRNANKQLVKQGHWRRILLKPNKIRSKIATKKLAQQILAKLNASQNFEQLAKTYSEDMLSKHKGGDMGWILPQVLPPEISKQLQTLPAKKPSGVLASNEGFEIWQNLGYKNLDLSEEALMLEVKNLLFRHKFTQQAELWANELRQGLYVEYR